MLDQLQGWAKGGSRPPPLRGVFMPFYNTSAWDTAQTGGLTYMPVKEKLAFANVYLLFRNVNSLVTTQRAKAAFAGVQALERGDAEAPET